MNMATEKTNKEKAFEMFEQGANDQEVGCELNLAESTVKSYHSQYRKLQRERNVKTETVKEVSNNIYKIELKHNYIPESLCMVIGKEVYDINYYIDIQDGSSWFDYVQIISALRTQKIIPIKFDSNIPDRYFRDVKIDDKLLSLIDRNALMELAQNIGDYTFLSSVMALYTAGNRDVFFKFKQIVDAFELIEHFTSSDNIGKRLDEVRAYNTGQLDFLHKEIDNDPFATEEQMLEKMQKLTNLRKARRTVKNELVLSQSLKSSLKYYKINCGQIYNIRQRVSKLLDDLYGRKYNSRVDGLDDWQREIVDKIIDTNIDAELELEEA